MTNLNVSGIYEIRCTVNNACYIGSSVNVRKRLWAHRGALTRGTHWIRALQKDWLEYGEAAFESSLLEPVLDAATLIDREQRWLDARLLGPQPVYNLRGIADRNTGITLSAETRAKMSLSSLGKTMSAKARAKVSEARRGKIHSAETRAKIAAATRARAPGSIVISDETRAKMRANRLGRKHSPETREKISSTNRGRVMGAEARLKMSEARRQWHQERRAAAADEWGGL